MARHQQVANIEDGRPDTGTIPVDQSDSPLGGSHRVARPAITIKNRLWQESGLLYLLHAL